MPGKREEEKEDRPVLPIQSFMGIKIRKILQKIHGTEGYPVRFFEYIGYFSGIAIWLPEDWEIDKYETKRMWLSRPEYLWRYVMIYNRIVEFEDVKFLTEQDSLAQQLEGSQPAWMSVVDSIMEIMPYISRFQDTLQKGYERRTTKPYPIYPNLGFYNTIHDKLIYYNWDFVYKDLVTAGYYAAKAHPPWYIAKLKEEQRIAKARVVQRNKDEIMAFEDMLAEQKAYQIQQSQQTQTGSSGGSGAAAKNITIR